MDHLPLELLGHIIDSLVDFDIRTPSSQTALATLARVNRTLNAIVLPRLYLHPVLTSKKRAQAWANFYSSKTSVCNLGQDWKAVRDVVVPLSLTFSPICGRAQSPSPPILDSIDSIDSIADILFPRNSSISSSFFFRNLTCFTISPERLIDVNFVAALFGPNSYNRDTVVDLSIRSGASQWHLILFLLDAHRQFPSDFDLAEGRSVDEENGRERMLTSGSSFREEEDSNRTSSSIDEDSNHGIQSILNRHSLLEDETRDFLPHVLSSRSIPVTPFANLVNLSLSLYSNAELYLIFLTPLFPTLCALKLDGPIWTTNHIEDDIAMFRYSITRRHGRIYPPMIDEEIQEEFALGLFDFETWIPLSRLELDRYPWHPHDGPNLDVLDLTECEVQWSDEL